MPFRIIDHESNEILLESPHVSDLIEYIDKNSEEYVVQELTISLIKKANQLLKFLCFQRALYPFQ